MDIPLTLDHSLYYRNADTSQIENLKEQQKSENLYFLRYLNKRYKDSIESYPSLLHTAFIIFGNVFRKVDNLEISDMQYEILEQFSTEPVPSINKDLNTYVKWDFEKETEADNEQKLEFPSLRKANFVVDWDRAKALYKKFLES